MIFDHLSPEQLAIVHHAGSRLVVQAAAGSGKTRVLTARYLKHVVDDGLSPDQILTITFTIKAAAEIRSRIVGSLRELGHQDAARTAETGPISTIHSFCESALRANSVYHGLDPEFSLESSAELAFLVRDFLREELADDHFHSPEIREFVRHSSGKARYGAERELITMIHSQVQTLLGQLRGTLLTPRQLHERYASPLKVAEYFYSHYRTELRPKQQRDIEAVLDQLRAGELSDAPDVRMWCRAIGLMQLTLRVWERYEAKLRSEQKLDFTLLESECIRMLEENPEVVARLQRQFEVVLVDEAQDLNPVQHKLLDLMQPKNLILIGDPQQSIYSFRQADRSLFIKKMLEFETMGLPTNYRSSRAVLGIVDAVFQPLWASEHQSMSPSPQAQEGQSGLLWLGAKDSLQTAKWVEGLLKSGIERRDIAILVRNESHGGDILRALQRANIEAHQFGSKNFYTWLPIKDLSHTLTALVDPTNEYSLLCCLHSFVVGLSLDSVVLARHEAQQANQPLLAYLRTFEPPLETDEPKLRKFLSWFEPLSLLADRMQAGEVLAAILDRSEILTTIARSPNPQQHLANIRKLQYMATQNPELTTAAFAARIQDIQMIRHREEDASAQDVHSDHVTIMNVHQSKGLEFPIVLIPNTFGRMNADHDSVVVDKETGLISFPEKGSIAHGALRTRRGFKNEQEELRLLYVAMTRAQRAVYVASSSEVFGKRNKSWARVIAEALQLDSEPKLPFAILKPEG